MNKTRRLIIAGNWKMHGSRTMVSTLLEALKQNIRSADYADVMVFPPYVFLEQVQKILLDTPIQWGAQNLATELLGAFTGEVSGTMLKEFGCRYVLVGHSERRSIYSETDLIIAKKFALALEAGLQPILCVGESLEQRKAGRTQEIVIAQLVNVLNQVGGVSALNNAIIAYEPVWAIGTGLTATPEQAQEVHAALRAQIANQNTNIADQLRILYGGSVKASNAQALFAMPDIDGGLIGGASLDAQEFLQIYAIAKQIATDNQQPL